MARLVLIVVGCLTYMCAYAYHEMKMESQLHCERSALEWKSGGTPPTQRPTTRVCALDNGGPCGVDMASLQEHLTDIRFLDTSKIPYPAHHRPIQKEEDNWMAG